MARTREIRPWYRWQWHRFANSRKVLRMGLAARGAYRGLLDKSWELGGKLPNDPEIMWRYAGALSAEEFAAVADQVLAMFTVSEDGKWLTNETLTEEWEATGEYLDDLSEKRRLAGLKGNEKRWGRKVSQEVATPRKASHSSNTVAIQDKSKTPLTPLTDSEAAIDRIWKLCPKLMNETRTKHAITEAVISEGGDATAVALLETMTAKYARLVEPYRNDRKLWQKVQAPWNWFQGRCYNDPPETWIPVGAFDEEKNRPRDVPITQPSTATWDEMDDATKAALADVAWRQGDKKLDRVPEHMRPYVKAAGGAA